MIYPFGGFRMFPKRHWKPLIKTVFSDLETPLSLYLKLANEPNTFLLESVQGGETWGRYSIIGLKADESIRVKNNQVDWLDKNQVIASKITAQPLQFIQDFLNSFDIDYPETVDLPRFFGGLVGFSTYESVGYFEPKLKVFDLPDPLNLPQMIWLLAKELVVFDNLSGVLSVIVHVDTENNAAHQAGLLRVDSILNQIQQPTPAQTLFDPELPSLDLSACQLDTEQEVFKAQVLAAKAYIEAGDVMQVVLSRRLHLKFDRSPLDLYRALRHVSPTPYLFLLNFEDMAIVGASPELLARVESNILTVRPIAGTRRRGKTPEEDELLAHELSNDPKEVAEHVMLIDLGRNDVGKVSQIGRVKLTQDRIIERYSHVMHMVSNVEGHLKPEISPLEAFASVFPAGTLSGAPKVRAMEIITELESNQRGIYGGAVGYLSFQGDMDMAIAIRTALIKDGVLYAQSGAGIVADSDPQFEWEETLAKSQALLKALGLLVH
jgi:anthranilate synthase component 1